MISKFGAKFYAAVLPQMKKSSYNIFMKEDVPLQLYLNLDQKLGDIQTDIKNLTVDVGRIQTKNRAVTAAWGIVGGAFVSLLTILSNFFRH